MSRREIDRDIQKTVMSSLKDVECVVLTGPRQIGKSTLVHKIVADQPRAVYKDLDDPKHCEEVGNGVDFFNQHADSLIVLDEIQRCPHLFPSLKAHIDRQRQRTSRGGGRFILLGSASLDIQQHVAMDLNGRSTEVQMSGLLPTELRPRLESVTEYERADSIEPIEMTDQSVANQIRTSRKDIELLWCRGGQPRSFLAETNELSAEYRRSFIANYLHQDTTALGLDFNNYILERCFQYLASNNGCQFDDQKLAKLLRAKPSEINKTINVLDQLLLVRILRLWSGSTRDRMFHKPKIYFRDSGLLHSVLELNDVAQVLSSSHHGESWEGFVIESIIGTSINAGKFQNGYYFRTDDGTSELDFVLDRGNGEKWGFEIKCSNNPKIRLGNIAAAKMIGVERRFLVHAGEERFTTQRDGFERLPLIETLAVVSEE